MTSPTFQDQLSAYLDGELEEAERARLEAELRVNPSLRAELDELREVAAFLRTHGPLRAPDTLHGRIMSAVAEEEPANTPWWAWLRRPFGIPIEGLAVAAAAAAVLWIALPDGGPDPVAAEEVAQGRAAPVEAPPEVASNDGEGATSAASAGGAGAGGQPGEAQEYGENTDGVAAVDAEALGARGSGAGGGGAAATETLAGNAGSPSKDSPSKASSSKKRLATEVPSVGTTPASTAEPDAGDVGATDGAVADAVTEGAGLTAGTAASGLDGSSGRRPVGRTAGYRYTVYADDPEVLGALQRIAARYQGAIRDAAGDAVQGARQTEVSADYAVRIEADALARFHRDLEALGVVEREADNRIFADELVDISVRVMLIGDAAPGSAAPEAAPIRTHRAARPKSDSLDALEAESAE